MPALRAGKKDGYRGNEKLSVKLKKKKKKKTKCKYFVTRRKKEFSSHPTGNHLLLRISLWILPSMSLNLPFGSKFIYSNFEYENKEEFQTLRLSGDTYYI